MATPTYASFRSQPPATIFTATAIAGSAASLARNFRVQFKNRAGLNLLSDVQTITSAGVQITLNNVVLPEEEIFWIVISCETTGNDVDAAILAQWKAREDDQLIKRTLPATITFTTDDHFLNNRAVNTFADLALLPISPLDGAIAYTADTGLYYRYDSEATTDADGRTLSYGAISEGLGNWVRYYGNGFNAYLADTTNTGGCDQRLFSVANALKIPPKIGAANGTLERYAINNGFVADGGSPIVQGRYTLSIALEGVSGYESVFTNRIRFYLRGYIDKDTYIMDTSMPLVSVPQVFNPITGLIELTIDLPRNHAAIFDFELFFDNADLIGLIPQETSLSLDIVEVLNVQGVPSEIAKILGDMVLANKDKAAIVPGLLRLPGILSIGAGYLPDLTNNQIIPNLQPDLSNQWVVISGILNGYATAEDAATYTLDYSEVIRACVSTETGISRLFQATATVNLSNNNLSVTVDHPIAASGGGIIRSDYPDSLIAGSDKAQFTPTQGYVFTSIGGVFAQSNLLQVTPSASDTFILNASDFTAIASLPVQADNFFGLFEPLSVNAIASSSGNLSGTAVVYFAYAYESPNIVATKIDNQCTVAIPTATSTLAQTSNDALLRNQNLADLPDVVLARTNLDVYDRAYIDSHFNDLNNPHQVTATQIGAASTTDLATTNNRVTANEANILLNTNFRLGTGTGANLNAGVAIGDLVQIEDVDGNGLAGLPAIDGSQLTGIGGQLTVEFVDGTFAAAVDDANPINYLIDTSAAIATMNLPATPPDKGIVAFSDRNKTFGTNNATIVPDPAHTIDGQANFLLDFDNEAVTLVFDQANNNYVVLDGIQNSSTGSGDMSTTVYDTDNNGIVDSAAEIDGIATAGNNKFYGTDAAGIPGFYDYLVGAAVKAALETIADPDKLLMGAINNARDISNQPVDDYCLTYELATDTLIYKPRIEVPGAGAILIPLSQSIFEAPDGTLSSYIPDIGSFTFTDIKILTTAGTPNNTLVSEQLEIGVTMTGAILDLTVSDTVIRTDWIFNSGDIAAIIARYDSDGNMNYLELDGSNVTLKTVVNDVVTTFDTAAFSFTSGTTYNIELQVVGVTYRVLIDGVEAIAQGISNDFLTATNFGIGRIN